MLSPSTSRGNLPFTAFSGLKNPSSRIGAPDPLPTGTHEIGFRFQPDGSGAGVGRLLVDGEEVAAAPLPEGVGASGIQIGGGGLRLGHDAGFPVSDDYRPPFPWTGVLHHVEFDARAPSERQLAAEEARLLRRE